MATYKELRDAYKLLSELDEINSRLQEMHGFAIYLTNASGHSVGLPPRFKARMETYLRSTLTTRRDELVAELESMGYVDEELSNRRN